MTREGLIDFVKFSKGHWTFTTKSGKEISEEQVIKALEQEPVCEDCISRQAVLDAINTDFHEDLSQLEDAINSLPPVNQFKPICCPSMGIDCEDCPAYEPKTGYWVKSIWSKDVWECSECGWEIYDQEAKTNYCPSCGCRMVEPQESEEEA